MRYAVLFFYDFLIKSIVFLCGSNRTLTQIFTHSILVNLDPFDTNFKIMPFLDKLKYLRDSTLLPNLTFSVRFVSYIFGDFLDWLMDGGAFCAP